jgi:hypothetical protein
VRRRLPDILLLAAIAAALALGPRWIDGRAALEWTRYYAAEAPGSERPAEAARRAGRAAARAVDRAAPLPFASDAARLALDLGRNLAAREPEAALALYREVGAALRRARRSPLRGLGLAGLAAEAGALEDGAKARPARGGGS